MRTTWIESAQFPPTSWCWYREAIRTNNEVEGWHLKLIKTAKKGNVQLYNLISLLGQDAKLVKLNCVLVKQERLARRQRKSTEVMHLRLVEWWDAYAAGQIQYPKLLERAATLMKPSKTWK